MTEHTSLLDLSQQLIHDDAARLAFDADPAGFLAGHGVGEFTPDEVGEALGHVADALPPSLAVQMPSSDEAWDGGEPMAGLVAQFRAVADVDPALVLDEPTSDELVDLDEFADGDPLSGLDAEPADLDDLSSGPGDEAEQDDVDVDPTNPNAEADGSTAEPTGGFGSGAADPEAPGAAAAASADDDAPAEGLAPAAGAPDPFQAESTGDAFGADDPFLSPQPTDEVGEADELDADNGDWDGDWDHLGGSHLL
jgi:hypothetical protein